MKKILFSLLALLMTIGISAQRPEPRPEPRDGECKSEQHECVYSPATRAMMRVDRLSRDITDLTSNEKEQLIKFFTSHYTKCAELKAQGTPMTKEVCRAECNAALRKILGDERYIQYLERMEVRRVDCGKPRHHGKPRGERCGFERPGCERAEVSPVKK